MGHQLVQGFPLFFPSTNPMNQPLWHSLASEMSVSRNRLLRTKAVSMAPGVLFTIGPTVLQHLQRSDTFRRGKCRNKHEENYENPKKPVTSHDVWSPIPGLKLDFTYTLIIRLMCAMWSGLASLWFINHHESHPHQHPPTLFTPHPPACAWSCASSHAAPRVDVATPSSLCPAVTTAASGMASGSPWHLWRPRANLFGISPILPKQQWISTQRKSFILGYLPIHGNHVSTMSLPPSWYSSKWKKGVLLERPHGAHHLPAVIMVQKNHSTKVFITPWYPMI